MSEHTSTGLAQKLLFLPVWQQDDSEKAQTRKRVRRHVMKNVHRAKRRAAGDSGSSLLDSQQARLPLLIFAHPPTQWRFYMPAFVNNCKPCVFGSHLSMHAWWSESGQTEDCCSSPNVNIYSSRGHMFPAEDGVADSRCHHLPPRFMVRSGNEK